MPTKHLSVQIVTSIPRFAHQGFDRHTGCMDKVDGQGYITHMSCPTDSSWICYSTHENPIWVATYLWWPGTNNKLEELVKATIKCRKEQNMPAVPPLHIWISAPCIQHIPMACNWWANCVVLALSCLQGQKEAKSLDWIKERVDQLFSSWVSARLRETWKRLTNN